ncbi:MAG TPA: hypothetical protein PLK63_17505, partial [Catalimonadaceae bacterium]|nr:hypothetical protein [Catalimonadaceae bacterium]
TEAQNSTVGTAAPANYGPHYTIPNRSHLILNGAGVSVYITADNQSNTQVGALMAANLARWTGGDEGIMLQGSLTVTNGTLNSRNGAGIIYRPTGGNRGLTITNGTVRLTQFRNFAGVTGNFFYQQDGGTFEIVGLGFGGLGYSTGQAAFSLASAGHSFYMSGGTLLLSGAKATSAAANPFIFDIQSVSSTATGGLIDVAPDSVWSFGSRTYEMNEGGSARIFNLSTRKVRGSVTLRARSTFTLNGTLTIGANTSLLMRNNVLNIGKDFILNGGYFQHTDPVASGASPLRFRAYVLGGDQNMVINDGATFDFSDFELRPWEPSPVANLLLVSGTLASRAFTVRNFRFFNGCTFNDGGFAITVTGELESWGSPT